MINVHEDTIVRIQYDDAAVVFAVLSCAVSISDGIPVNEDKLYHFQMDPLTTTVSGGLTVADTENVVHLEPVDSLPITSNFLIDSIDQFYENPVRYPNVTDQPKDFAVSFLNVTRRFLVRSNLTCRNVGERELWSHDLTSLGIDFMRQFYRSIKKHSITTLKLPDSMNLEYLRNLAACSRTHDKDWSRFPRIPG